MVNGVRSVVIDTNSVITVKDIMDIEENKVHLSGNHKYTHTRDYSEKRETCCGGRCKKNSSTSTIQNVRLDDIVKAVAEMDE